MQAVSSSGEDRGDGPNASHLGRIKLSVSDLVSDDFKRAWLALKDIHDKELHRLQMKLTNMRKARLTEGRRYGPVAKNKSGTETRETSDSKSCERCLMHETYKKMLQQEFSIMQQKRLAEIAELTVENSKLKEENRKLSEKIKVNLPRICLSFSDSDYEDFIPSIQMKKKQVYIVKEPSQPVQLFPRNVVEPHNEQQQSLCDLDGKPNPDDNPPQLNYEGIFEVPETSLDSPSVEENLAQEASVLPSCTAYSLTTTLETSKKDDVISISSLSGVKKTQQWEKNTFAWSLSSVSSGEAIIVSETSEENMPCKPSNVLPSLTKKKKSNSTQVFPVDYTSKYVQRRRLALSGFRYKNDIPMESGNAPLPSKEKPSLNNTSESENVRTCEKPESDSERVPSGTSVLKRKIKK